jgi:hypothetical protein
MPILDAIERLLRIDQQQTPEPAYNIAAQRSVVFGWQRAPQTVNPVRERLIIPMTQFRYNHEIRTAIVQCILERAQHVMQGLCPALYQGTSPLEIQAYADRVLAQENIPLGAALLNPAHLDFVNEAEFPCYVHPDAPIGAVIFLPDPDHLGVLVRGVGDQNLAGIVIHGMPITVLTEEGVPGFLPDQESGPGLNWLETLERKPPPEPEVERKDVWERLGDDELF